MKLASYTTSVYRNRPYSDTQLTRSETPLKTAIPSQVGDPSPIKYVIYIIKENRTYDQVFGDPTLTMFGEKITPNHHKLARKFVQLDNLYCNGHVSDDGHPWSTLAYNPDYIARNWALTYSRRPGVEGDDEGNLSKGLSGYLWDACARAGLSYRSDSEYGKRVNTGEGVSMIRTMELILGLPLLSQYDAAATPMFKRFTDKVDVTTYTHEPA